jgi:hypothetical protein
MAWRCISSRGVGWLAFIERIMDKYEYISILANNLKALAEDMGLRSFVFQQDNDQKHTSKYVRDFFESEWVELLQLPSQSPDLNPIKHVWAHIKRVLRGKVFPNKEELKSTLMVIWNGISQQTISNIVGSMPKRVRAVLKADGKNTFY